MSSFEDTRRIVTIVGICIGVLIGLSVLATIIRCVRRAGVAADFKAQYDRNALLQEQQRRRQFFIDRNDLEYGLDTRAEAQASSYYGGMADVTHFGAGRAITNPQHQSGSSDTTNIVTSTPGIYSGERQLPSPPRQPEPVYHPTIPRPPVTIGGPSSLQQHGPIYDSPSELARKDDDVPPAYSSVVAHR